MNPLPATNYPMAQALDGVTFRPLQTIADYEDCIALQRTTWGAKFTDIVPLSILKVCQRVGGVTAGAFDHTGRMLGFVFGLTGVEDGRIVHWSDMLAVVPEMQSRGLGAALKLYQRELLLPIHVETMYWTYDPLVARNAYFNLNKLGARVHEYVENMYGESGSDLHRGLGTDRFVVAWDLASPDVERALRGERTLNVSDAAEAPVINTRFEYGRAHPVAPTPPEGSAVRIEVPEDIQIEKAASPEAGAAWRASTRAAFLLCFERGYHVDYLYRDADRRCYYVLKRTP